MTEGRPAKVLPMREEARRAVLFVLTVLVGYWLLGRILEHGITP